MSDAFGRLQPPPPPEGSKFSHRYTCRTSNYISWSQAECIHSGSQVHSVDEGSLREYRFAFTVHKSCSVYEKLEGYSVERIASAKGKPLRLNTGSFPIGNRVYFVPKYLIR